MHFKKHIRIIGFFRRMGMVMKMKKGVLPNSIRNKKSHHSIPLSILDELAARFIINVPEEEKHDLVRICFQLELSHWFFIDFIVPNNPGLVAGTILEFGAHMFHHIDYLRKYVNDIESIVEDWRIYKKSVPVNGAVLLNKKMDKVLMVKSFSSKASWAFPRGKINQEEKKHDCAIREVYEETGYDASALIDKDLYIEKVINDQTVRLYLIAGVEEEFLFAPRARGEISDIRWWRLTELPIKLSDKLGTLKRLGVSPNEFYNAIPFIRDIQEWVTQECVRKASLAVIETVNDNNNEYDVSTNCEENPMNVINPKWVTNFCAVKAPSEVFEPGTVNNQENDVEPNNAGIPTDISEPFCPESWKSFRFSLEDIENSLLSC